MQHTREHTPQSMQPAPRMILASSSIAVVPALQWTLPEYRGKTVAFIATASYVESYGIASRIMAWRLRLMGMRVQTIAIPHTQTDSQSLERMRRALNSADILYVCGGNTFYLLQELHASGADHIITARVQAGVPYIGESAGAVIAGPDINYIRHMDNIALAPTLNQTRGLALEPYAIVPHYGSRVLGQGAATILAKHQGTDPLLPLHNNQALIVQGTAMRVITCPTPVRALADLIM